MKFKVHVPSMEYGFIEAEDIATAKDAVNVHKSITGLLQMDPEAFADVPNGLDTKEWAKFRTTYRNGDGKIDPDMQEQLERCNSMQRYYINQEKLEKRK